MTDVKDAFFIHSAGDPEQLAFLRMVEGVLDECGFCSWQYGDWDWQQIDEAWRRNRGGTGRLDVRRVIRGHLDAFRATTPGAVDQTRLISLLEASRIIVLMLPADSRLTDGVALELDLITRDHGLLRHREEGWTRYLLCRFDVSDTYEPPDVELPEFDDKLVMAVVASNQDPQRYEHLAWALGCMILRHLLEMDLNDLDAPEYAADFDKHTYFKTDVERAAILLQRANAFSLARGVTAFADQLSALEASYWRATAVGQRSRG